MYLGVIKRTTKAWSNRSDNDMEHDDKHHTY